MASEVVPAAVAHPEITQHSISQHQETGSNRAKKPYLVVVTGTDAISTGLSARLWLPTGGRWAHSESLVHQRWLMPPMNVEDIVRITIRGLHTYLVRSGAEPANTDGTSV